MRRSIVIAAGLLATGVLAACGAQGVVSATPQTVIGTVSTPTVTFPIVAAFHLQGNATKGAGIFGSAGCGGCHTLAAAHATGQAPGAPNLDSLKPDYQAVTAQVTNGSASMPSFKSQLSTQQIADVAAYVVKSTGGKLP